MNTASNWTEFSAALSIGAGPRRMWSTPTTRGTLLTMRWDAIPLSTGWP